MDKIKSRKDLMKTSSGVGLNHNGFGKDPTHIEQRSVLDKLPPYLSDDQESYAIIKNSHYKTTTGTYHDYKSAIGFQSDKGINHHVKPAPHEKVQYIKFMHNMLNSYNPGKPLSMGSQITETHEEFRARPSMINTEDRFNSCDIGLHLADHLNDSSCPTETRPNGVGIKRSLLLNNEAYRTTTGQCHRYFWETDLVGYPRKDALTFWDAEDYPRTHLGFGNQTNKVQKEFCKSNVMRDKSDKSLGLCRTPYNNANLLSGFESEYAKNYREPSKIATKSLDLLIKCEPIGPGQPFDFSEDYRTESSNISSGYPVHILR